MSDLREGVARERDMFAVEPASDPATEAALESADLGAATSPRRPRGTRSRAGNAMERTRQAVLDGACRCAQVSGVRRTTMTEIAAAGGVAKATLYNHFRTKDEVWAAAVQARVRALGAECVAVAGGFGLRAALVRVAERLREYSVLRRVARDEPLHCSG